MDRELKYRVQVSGPLGERAELYWNVRTYAVTPSGYLVMFFFDKPTKTIKLNAGQFINVKVTNK